MIDIEKQNERYIFALGHLDVQHRIPITLDVIRALAEINDEVISALQSGTKRWTSGDWTLSAAIAGNQHDRDMKRQRIFLEIGELNWHLLAHELRALCIRSRGLLAT